MISAKCYNPIVHRWLKLQEKIEGLHEKVSNTRKDWHFKLSHYLCDLADNIFVEDINFVSWSRGIVRKPYKIVQSVKIVKQLKRDYS